MIAGSLGAYVADNCDLLKANARNELGYYESKLVYRLNEAILSDNGHTWRSIRTSPAASLDRRAQIRDLVSTYYRGHVVSVIKDPRLCLLIPYWAAEAGPYYPTDIRFVYAIRHPAEVASSLKVAWGMGPAEALDLWIFYNSMVINFLARKPTTEYVVVDMSSGDVGAYGAAIRRVARSLELPYREWACEAIYSPRHKHFSGLAGRLPEPVAEAFHTACGLYTELSAVANGKGTMGGLHDWGTAA